MRWSWHRVLKLVISLFAAITGGINVGYYNKIRLNPDKCRELTSTEALVGLWLNIILTILSSLLFIWTLIESEAKNKGMPDTVVHKQTNTIYHKPESTDYQTHDYLKPETVDY